MATSRILEAIDTYIAELVSARALLTKKAEAALKAKKESSPKKRQTARKKATTATTPANAVSVQVIPPKGRREGGRAKSHVRESGALSSSLPRGPVVVRAAEIAEQKAKAVRSNGGLKDAAPSDPLEDIAREVARRLGR